MAGYPSGVSSPASLWCVGFISDAVAATVDVAVAAAVAVAVAAAIVTFHPFQDVSAATHFAVVPIGRRTNCKIEKRKKKEPSLPIPRTSLPHILSPDLSTHIFLNLHCSSLY